MSIVRTYFDKNTTIISGSKENINTGQNPVTEIFYGTNISRFLFYVDFSALKAQINDRTVNPSTIVRHTLKMKNTSNFDVLPYRDNRDELQFSSKQHATSFDLELKPIYELWDEGNGYDFEPEIICTDENSYVEGYANWLHRTTLQSWIYPGAIPTGSTVTLATQHFDRGNEDVLMDITDFVNQVISGTTTGGTYNGFCLKFTNSFETDPMDANQIVAFFTRHTHTFFEPFIETEFNDLVQDDRKYVVLDQPCNLVLYVAERGEMFNLDVPPTCTIGTTIFPVTQISKGIYSASVILPSTGYTDVVMYHDVWSNIVINGVTQPNITMNITPLPASNHYQIGNLTYEPLKYGVSISGIKREEQVQQGERRKIFVNLREPYTVSNNATIDNVYYRMYVKQGVNQITVIDWTPVNRAYDSNYFIVDTTWLVPQQYFIDIKIESRDEINIYNEETRFSVINQA
jgi:hypothetical protein